MTTRKGCPRPKDSAYATETGAEFAARRVQVPVGKLLTPYECPCGWWHLTGRPRTVPQPAQLKPLPGDGAPLKDAPDGWFRAVTLRDVRGTGTREEALALRHPDHLTRWRRTLKSLWTDVEQQFADRAGDTSEEARAWRTKASVYRSVIAERRTEAKERITRAAQLTAEQRYQWACAEAAVLDGRSTSEFADVVEFHGALAVAA
ncbi:hypothetical protein [Streptomyces ipomoeae]|uniref:hypothetical protein n=1 Tax=Streptomyces ipomoeae TaxID=103232 RepID=UPI0015F06719|nr:hypothetical protein [Streptomyces ipomoeae]